MSRRSYHHGSLQEALVDAGLDVVEAEGADAISLRELARQVGVSSGAPYRHFSDRDALLRAVAARGFQQFDAALRETSDRCRCAPAIDRVQALGVTYVRFAAEHPRVFRLMFGPTTSSPVEDEALVAARRAAGRHLPAALEDVQAAGIATETPLAELVEVAWSLVHGVAMLYLDGLVGRGARDPVAAATEMAERVTGKFARLLSPPQETDDPGHEDE